jgi:hypothetical protein
VRHDLTKQRNTKKQHTHNKQPSILRAFSGASVFLTGGTGFVGSVLIEQLLRLVPDIRTIYVLVRPKKGLSGALVFFCVWAGPPGEKRRSELPPFPACKKPSRGRRR